MYLLDANAFITPKRSYCAFDIAPGYWEFLIQEYKKDNIASIDTVYQELTRGKDDLVDWVSQHKYMFIKTGDTDYFIKAAKNYRIGRLLRIGTPM